MTDSRKPRASTAGSNSGTARSPRSSRRRTASETRPRTDAAASSTPVGERPNFLIRASAGSGKTFQLSGEYIDRLRRSEPDRILATTFTRAAAGEILERILVRLAEAALSPTKLQELAQQIGATGAEPFTREECLSRLADLTRNLHRARVSTLDSFFIQLAQCFSLELGLPPGWRIIDEIEESQLVTQAVERLLHGGSAGDVGRLLNLLARGNAARTVTGLLRQAVRDFHEVYCETAAEAWQGIPTPAPLSSDDLQWAIQDLERIPVPAAWAKAKELESACAAEGRWETFLSKGIAAKVAAGETTYCRKPIPTELLEVYQRLVRHAGAVLVGQLASRTRVTWELLDRYDAEIRALKHEHRVLTFADVTRALGRGWGEGALRHLDFRLDSSISHLLLDEFQDTSIPQWHAMEPLARRVATTPSASLFCVGDQKQAIYGWRGGVAELFDHLRSSLPGIEESPLARSYRSAPAIIEAVNRICQGLVHHNNLSDAEPAVRRWLERFDPHDTARTDLPGWVTLETPPEAIDCDENENHLDFAADRISELARTTPAATIGVLAVSNDSVADLARRLRVRGLHVSEEGSSSLNDNVPVQLILSLLQIADHPSDESAWFHLVNSPAAAALEVPQLRDRLLIEQFSAKLRRELLHAGYGQCVERWAEAVAPYCDPRGVSRLRQLVNLAHDYDKHATLRATDFVGFIESKPLRQPAASRIRVMTIHHAKGLEFDIVVLPEFHKRLIAQTPQFVIGRNNPVESPVCVMRYANEQLQSLLPENLQQVFQQAYERHVEERLCVLYVALTRARHALHMIVDASKGERSKLSLSMSHLVRASLLENGSLPPGQRVTISGDPGWAEQVWGPAGSAPVEDCQATSREELAPLQINLAPPAVGAVSGLPDVLPSRHGAHQVRMQDILAAPRLARARGTLIHSWFEELTWLDDGAPDDQALRRIARRLEPHDLDLDRAIRDFESMLRVPAIAWALSRAAYLSPDGWMASVLRSLPESAGLAVRVQNERRFAVPIDGEMIRGCMDRLVLLEQNGHVLAADVCDYKTDVFKGLDPLLVDERLAGYRQQLRLYARAAARLYALPEERVTARLFLLGPGRVEEVR